MSTMRVIFSPEADEAGKPTAMNMQVGDVKRIRHTSPVTGYALFALGEVTVTANSSPAYSATFTASGAQIVDCGSVVATEWQVTAGVGGLVYTHIYVGTLDVIRLPGRYPHSFEVATHASDTTTAGGARYRKEHFRAREGVWGWVLVPREELPVWRAIDEATRGFGRLFIVETPIENEVVAVTSPVSGFPLKLGSWKYWSGSLSLREWA